MNIKFEIKKRCTEGIRFRVRRERKREVWEIKIEH
jgi:hypothetical protein